MPTIEERIQLLFELENISREARSKLSMLRQIKANNTVDVINPITGAIVELPVDPAYKQQLQTDLQQLKVDMQTTIDALGL